MKPLVKIGYLITQHDDKEIPFTKCEGCPTCDEITRLRKIIDPESNKNVRKSKVKKKQTEPRKTLADRKMEVYDCIMQGMKVKEIAEKLDVQYKTLSVKVSVWFPNYKELKIEAARENLKSFIKDEFTYETYKEMKELNIPDSEIARHYNISRSTIEHRVAKWRNEEEITEKIRNKMTQPPARERINTLIQENANLEVQLHEKETTIQLLQDRIAELESGKKYKTVG